MRKLYPVHDVRRHQFSFVFPDGSYYLYYIESISQAANGSVKYNKSATLRVQSEVSLLRNGKINHGL